MNTTSSVAIATAEAAGLEQIEREERATRVAALVKLPLNKLDDVLAGQELATLRDLLVAEEAKGDDARKGAVEMIERAIDAHPDQVAALNAAPPAINQEGQSGDDGARAPADDAGATGGSDAGAGELVNAGGDSNGGGDTAAADTADRGQGGAVSMILTAEELADVTGPAAADAIAATVEAIAPAPATRAPQIDDESADWTNAEVLAHVLAAGAAVIFARRDMVHLELVPIVLPAQAFTKAYDGERVLLVEDVKLSGIGLARSLPIEEAWLVLDTEDGPVLVRRCEMSGELNLDPGREVGFGPRALVF